MPEHVHLLLGEPQRETLADVLKSLKQGVSRRLIGEAEHFWQKRYYDFNIRNEQQFVEKLRYIHRNPVKRELRARPEDWSGAALFTMRLGKKGAWRLNRNGQREGVRGMRGGFVRWWNCSRGRRFNVSLLSGSKVVELPHSSQKKA
jgi:putative transposase